MNMINTPLVQTIFNNLTIFMLTRPPLPKPTLLYTGTTIINGDGNWICICPTPFPTCMCQMNLTPAEITDLPTH